MGVVDTGVTGGGTNLLGSLTASARALPENVDWQNGGTSHIMENCGHEWVWQLCTPVEDIPGSPCVDEVQTLIITGADGGTFTLDFLGQVTAPIAYGSAALAVQLALEALPNVDPGDIVVSGGPDSYSFSYGGGQYACSNVASLIADCSLLTGPGGPCVNEVQNLTITGFIGGDFTLTFDPTGGDAQTTGPIPWGSTVPTVQAALDALSNVDPGDIVVSGSPNNYTFTYGGQYACTDLPLIVANCEELEMDLTEGGVDLATASTYGILAGTPDITNTGFTTVSGPGGGDVGINPASSVIGFPPGVASGTIRTATSHPVETLQAKADLTAAYLDAEGRASDFDLDVYGGDIGGQTLAPGVYTTNTIASLGITGVVTLDAGGDPDAVWIFQIDSTLITAASSNVSMVDGGRTCNVYWQVGSSATLGSSSTMSGTVLALTSITANTGSTVDGRILARNGAVVLDSVEINVPVVCAADALCEVTTVTEGEEATDAPECSVVTDTQGSPEIPFSDGQKPLVPGTAAVNFKPFLIEYNAASCPGGFPGDLDLLENRARRGLTFRTSSGIALALSSSEPDGAPNDSPSLPTTAVDITPGTGPSRIVNTVSGLIQDAYECGANGELFIHAPAWTLPQFLDSHLLTQVGNVYKMGIHTVVFDEGYTGEAPTGSPVALLGQAWIYVTGPIEYATGPVQILTDTTRGVSILLNRANVIAAQIAIYRFDPCCVFASLTEVCA